MPYLVADRAFLAKGIFNRSGKGEKDGWLEADEASKGTSISRNSSSAADSVINIDGNNRFWASF